MKTRKLYALEEEEKQTIKLAIRKEIATVHGESYHFLGNRSNTCPECGSREVRVENYDILNDGDIICNRCNAYIRKYG